MLHGERVAIRSEDQGLRLTEASAILGISRLLVVLRMDRGDLPLRFVGRHRRALLKDVLTPKSRPVAPQAPMDALADNTANPFETRDPWPPSMASSNHTGPTASMTNGSAIPPSAANGAERDRENRRACDGQIYNRQLATYVRFLSKFREKRPACILHIMMDKIALSRIYLFIEEQPQTSGQKPKITIGRALGRRAKMVVAVHDSA